MRKTLLVFCFLFTALALFGASEVTPVQAESDPLVETGQSLCLPGVYLAAPADCLALGPSSRLTDLGSRGLTFPPRPLPAKSPDQALNIVDIYIAKINLDAADPAPMYGSFEDAIAGSNPTRYLAAGPTRYVSFINLQRDGNNKAYVQLKSGEWMRASPAQYPGFQGLLFTKTPANSFGWIVDEARARKAPGYASPEVGPALYRETKVQIYDVQPADGVDWYLIAPGRWVERRYIRQVRINTTPPEGVTSGRWIDVNLYDQTIAVYENNQLVFASLVATGGDPFFTQPGLFQIYKKKPLETMSGSFEADRSDFYYLEDVPWTMYFDQARALHGAYWRAFFGYQGTHGCVNLSIGDSHWLFDWAVEGDYVHVWDPSGQTPTDPEYYGAGGA